MNEDGNNLDDPISLSPFFGFFLTQEVILWTSPPVFYIVLIENLFDKRCIDHYKRATDCVVSGKDRKQFEHVLVESCSVSSNAQS